MSVKWILLGGKSGGNVLKGKSKLLFQGSSEIKYLILKDLKLGPVVSIMGHSMGGRTAMMLSMLEQQVSSLRENNIQFDWKHLNSLSVIKIISFVVLKKSQITI